MLRLQIQPFSLRGPSRHPGDFQSQGILVICSRTPGTRALTPRWSLCSLHGKPACGALGKASMPTELSERALLFCSLTSQPPARSFLVPQHAVSVGVHAHTCHKSHVPRTAQRTKPHTYMKQACLHIQEHKQQ